jgi:NADPH:quinone reductase-like Zn-dependent oxidoreductase
VTTYSLPAGSWAEKFTALAEHLALVPAGMPMTVAAALPVPALTADQALDAVTVRPDETVLVHGAGGVTGGLLVHLAAHRGARVIATAGQAGRARALGAPQVIDYHEPDWPAQVRALTSGGTGVDAAVNAARSGSADAVRAVRDGGRLATITGDLPPAERGITRSDIVVVPDGPGSRGWSRCSRRTRSRWGPATRWPRRPRPWRGCARARTAPRSCSSPDHVHRSMPSGAGAPNSMASTYPSVPGVRSARMAR